MEQDQIGETMSFVNLIVSLGIAEEQPIAYSQEEIIRKVEEEKSE